MPVLRISLLLVEIEYKTSVLGDRKWVQSGWDMHVTVDVCWHIKHKSANYLLCGGNYVCGRGLVKLRYCKVRTGVCCELILSRV